MNKKNFTIISIPILVFAIIVMAFFGWRNVKQEKIDKKQEEVLMNQEDQTKQDQAGKEEIEEEQGSEEEIFTKIPEAFYKKFPNWPQNITSIEVLFSKDKNLIGKMQHSQSEYYWFANRSKGEWEIVEYGDKNYGICNNFYEYDYPTEMIPDCWDKNKKKLVETSNPDFFYNKGFSLKDKKEILNDFLRYIKEKSFERYNDYKDKELYLIIDDKSIEDYFKGSVVIGGLENLSTPYILALKVNNTWKVVFQGQDYPECELVDRYDFSKVVVDKCIKTKEGKLIELER